MTHRVLSLLLLAAALAAFLGAPLAADEKADKNTHTGTFVSAKGNEFTMEAKGKEHSHTLAEGAKVYVDNGKEGRLEDLRKGQVIRVTTREGDPKTATKVEVVKKAKDAG